ncbi:hypothetical protein [Nocardia sp. NPDC050175]|uniref:hypothetical protein n=1 Tax=Nocardia sp. NPDC050175 TaxID=3364317 RepID=UPI003794E4A2
MAVYFLARAEPESMHLLIDGGLLVIGRDVEHRSHQLGAPIAAPLVGDPVINTPRTQSDMRPQPSTVMR